MNSYNKKKDEITIRFEAEARNINLIKTESFTEAEARKILDEIYAEDIAVHQPFGELVAEIMRKKGVTKEWRGTEILDAPRAAQLTGLNENIFRTTMFKPDCTIEMPLVISICIGFKLSPELARKLLDAAGLSFRLSNPDHLAYLFLLEHCRELSIAECNKVLDHFGVKKHRQLGSYGRGPNGEPTEYQIKK